MKKEITLILSHETWAHFFTEILWESKYDYKTYSQKFYISDISIEGNIVVCLFTLSFRKDMYGIHGNIQFGAESKNPKSRENDTFLRKKILKFISDQKKKYESSGFEKIYFTDSYVDRTGYGMIEFSLGKQYSSVTGDTRHFETCLKMLYNFFYFEVTTLDANKNITIAAPDASNFIKQKTLSYDGNLPDWLKWWESVEKTVPRVISSEDKVTLADMWGNKQLKIEIGKLISFFQNREHFQKWNIDPPRWVLLYGPPWTGKTLAAKIIAGEVWLPFYRISSTDIISKWIGDSARNMKAFFDKLVPPCVVFIDEIDALVPNRDGKWSRDVTQEEIQAINVLLQVIDGFDVKKDILFIGATNRIDAMDPAILRAGRLDYKIFVDYPDFEARKEIWDIYLKKSLRVSNYNYLDEKVDLAVLAKNSDRFTGADIAEVIRRMLSDYALGSLVSSKIVGIINGETTLRWLLYLIEKYKNERILNHDIVPTKSTFRLHDIAGSYGLKKELEKIVKQYKHRHIFEEAGIDLPRGILLYGPPGTGKTLAAKAIAGELWVIFYVLNPKDFLSTWANESVVNIEKIFSSFETPCIVFLDEIDAILGKRDSWWRQAGKEDAKLVNAFLQQIDGFSEKRDVLFIGATNRIESLDDAVLRAWRFDYKIFVDLPDDDARSEIFRMYIEKSKTKLTNTNLFHKNIDYEALVATSSGFTGADISEIIRRVKQDFVIQESEKLQDSTLKNLTRHILTEDILKEIEKYRREHQAWVPQKRTIGFWL